MKCYNGCPDKELQAILDDQANAQKELSKMDLHATYFPMEKRYMVFTENFKSDFVFHTSIREALDYNKGKINEETAIPTETQGR